MFREVETLAPVTAPAAIAEGGDVTVIQSGWRLGLRSFAQNRLAVVGVGIIVFFLLFCYLGPFFYHGNVSVADVINSNSPPVQGHPAGTDATGFDVLGQLMVGGQSSLEIGLLAAAIATLVGTLWGAIAGLAGGIVDGVMMRIVDVVLSIPLLFVILIVGAKYGSNVVSLALIIGIFSWLVPARLVRGEVLTLRVRDFVAAARAAGSSRSRLVLRHLIPNALSVVIVNITFQVADAILLVAALGFLGFGLNFPTFDWGDMLSGGTAELLNGYWWQVYPVGICIVLTVMAMNLIGDALRDALDVRLRRR
ncbi:MAG TPA: ABC transporter permease [Streptosporangiaceae bacterium]|nr:ABC transporter permease [Streptosporangiaceae bacterium]